jgi:vesicle coat complex subunit
MVDSDSSQRSLILAAVTEIGIRTLKPINRALLISLQDRNADVRKNAIRDVTRIYDLVSQINQLLNHAADDSDAEVRETARWALGQLNSARSTIPEVEGFPSLSVDTSKLTGDSSVSSEWFIGEDLRDRQ